MQNLQANSRWCEFLRTCYRVSFQFLSCKSGVDMEPVDWKSKVHQVMSEYPQLNYFNVDEMGLFCQQMPGRA